MTKTHDTIEWDLRQFFSETASFHLLSHVVSHVIPHVISTSSISWDRNDRAVIFYPFLGTQPAYLPPQILALDVHEHKSEG